MNVKEYFLFSTLGVLFAITVTGTIINTSIWSPDFRRRVHNEIPEAKGRNDQLSSLSHTFSFLIIRLLSNLRKLYWKINSTRRFEFSISLNCSKIFRKKFNEILFCRKAKALHWIVYFNFLSGKVRNLTFACSRRR